MAKLNVDTSIVDYLKSIGQDSSYQARASLALQQGIEGYSGTAEQNIQLLNILRATPIGTQTPAGTQGLSVGGGAIRTVDELNASLDAGQKEDFKQASSLEDPRVRTSSLYTDAFAQIREGLTQGIGARPEPIDRAGTYQALREEQGISVLEEELTALQSDARAIKSAMRARIAAERAKPVAMNVIEGRISEAEQQEQQRLDAINDEISLLTNQLTLRYNVVDTIMKYTGEDYRDAVDSYDSQFSQNISLMNAVRGIVGDIKSDQDRVQDNARANLQIIYNNLSSGGASLDDLDETTELNIIKLELEAGLPIGFYKNIFKEHPGDKIFTSTPTEENGRKYMDLVMIDKNGKLYPERLYLGGVDVKRDTEEKLTPAEQKAEAFSIINQIIGKKVMQDPKSASSIVYVDSKGYFTSQGFKLLIDNAVEDGIDRKTFLAQYGSYLDPDDLEKYSLTGKERYDLLGY